MSPGPAKKMFDSLVQQVRQACKTPENVQEGVFGAFMEVSLVSFKFSMILLIGIVIHRSGMVP